MTTVQPNRHFLIVASFLLTGYLVFNSACTESPVSATVVVAITDTIRPKDTSQQELPQVPGIPINDSLDELASLIAGTCTNSRIYPKISASRNYQDYRIEFSKRWQQFDTGRVQLLQQFQKDALFPFVDSNSTLFYPFSGPDYLYAGHFFPKSRHYVMVGLEPLGSLSALTDQDPDSLSGYFNALNTSLNAILKYSFFRTNSMEEDLKKEDLDGVLHVLLLFIKRKENSLISCKTFELDSLGNKTHVLTIGEPIPPDSRPCGIEIQFVTKDRQLKVLDYLCVNLSDPALKKNKGFMAFMGKDSVFTTYLKGASYLLHKTYFSRIRQLILTRGTAVIQDDSGIAYHYFSGSNRNWSFKLFGQYTKPISMFRKFYQPALDSLYTRQGAQPLGFGIGYNFKDKNSNLMIAIPKQ